MERNNSVTEVELIQVIQQFLMDSQMESSTHALHLTTSLQRHLGIDSISRAELFTRIEKRFHVHLPDKALAESETIGDILTALNTNAGMVLQDVLKINRENIAHDVTPVDPSYANSLIEVLLIRALQTPNLPHILLQLESGKEEVITYGTMLEKSQRVAHSFIQMGLVPGDTIAIMQPTHSSFFYTFFGALIAGCIPVPIYPPLRPQQIERYAKQEANILRNAEVRVLVTFHEAEKLSHLLRSFVPSLKAVVTIDNLLATNVKASIYPAKKEDFALIQYTSGSTSMPKGVLLTHGNLLSNIRSYGEAVEIQPNDVAVSWAPLYHDLGLIGMWLGSFYFGIPLVLLSPITFLNRPERWLWAMHRYRGTISGGPNFSYELCVRKVDHDLIQGLDLSSWRLAINGAEAVQPQTLDRFTEKFAPFGFKREAFFPVYGLAESTVGLASPKPGTLPKIDRIDRRVFEEQQKAQPSSADNALAFVSCGKAIPLQHIRVVDENNEVLGEREIGMIQFQGPSSMQGYYRNPEATQEIYHNGWWDTGDLGYLVNDEIHITGRKKDVIIKAGRNLYPTEIEDLTSKIPEIRKGCVIAFGVTDDQRGTEQLIIVAETRDKNAKNKNMIIEKVNEAIASALDISPDHIILVPPKTIPKTSSGKLQRSACKTSYLQGKLTGANPVWVQMSKLITQTFFTSTNRIVKRIAKFIFTLYLAFFIIVLFFPIWLLSFVTSRKTYAHIFKFGSIVLCWVALCPIRITGKQFRKNNKVIFVSNHASYIDSLVLMAVLPPNTRFVGKIELFKVPFLRTFLTKLGHISVQRQDVNKSLEDVEQIKAVLEEGYPVCIFPEGTFGYAAGLRPFKLGAFKLAAETQTDICPLAIQGTRYILRGEERLFEPHMIKIDFLECIHPTSNEWTDITALKNQARLKIAENCGEPTLDFITPVIIKSREEKVKAR